jgi:hypothetical protein
VCVYIYIHIYIYIYIYVCVRREHRVLKRIIIQIQQEQQEVGSCDKFEIADLAQSFVCPPYSASLFSSNSQVLETSKHLKKKI